MLPYKTIISIERNSAQPIYHQLAAQIVSNIENGILRPDFRLPGSREMAKQLEVSRQTVITAYEELQAQGWIDIFPRSGPVIASPSPQKPSPEPVISENGICSSIPGFPFKEQQIFSAAAPYPNPHKLAFNDGFPDVRIAPMESLMRAYRNVSKRAFSYKYLMYHYPEGSLSLRTEIAKNLQETRGLKVSQENILITKGSQMAIYLAANLILEPGDVVVAGERNYFAANAAFRHAGGKVFFIPVDEKGLDVEALESVCRIVKVKLIYITPHHYHPTTVTLSAERRARLLELSAKYHFAILEDDYDYDFHYSGSPVLPLASADTNGNVIYAGSLCKTIAPAIRTGFMVAPEKFIKAATQLRRVIDRQGDTILEEAVAEIYRDGTIKRHMKKALKLYKTRRDYLAELLHQKLPDDISFTLPEGGMAIWATFKDDLNLADISENASKQGLFLSDGQFFCTHESHRNATRLGFASLNFEELDQATDILKDAVLKSRGS